MNGQKLMQSVFQLWYLSSALDRVEEWAGTKVCFVNNEQSWHKAHSVGIEEVTPFIRSSSEHTTLKKDQTVLPNCPTPQFKLWTLYK